MVGIVLVSHSAELGEAVRALVEQVAQGKVSIAVAGGIDDPANPFGTDAAKVQQAIESVYSADGVLVLMDLGSAILSAEMARDFLLPEQQARVRLSGAPFVEGAVAAAVQAAVGATLDQVAAEALAGRQPKAEQLGEITVPALATTLTELEKPAAAATLTVRNAAGLHARPAALFVQMAARFQSDVRVRNLTRNRGPASAKSSVGLMTLQVSQGDQIAVSADGPDAAEAIAALTDLVESNFGEPEAAPRPTFAPPLPVYPSPAPPPPPSPPGPSPILVLSGIAASPGIAIGPAFVFRPESPAVGRRKVEDLAAEGTRFRAAVEQARAELVEVQGEAEVKLGADQARIFEAQRMFLQDPALIDQAEARIDKEHLNAEAAIEDTVEELAALFERMDAPILQARAADVRDVGTRLIRLLTGWRPPSLSSLTRASIIVASDLKPSDTAQLDPKQVLGLATAAGSATSHTAILARGLGLPAVVGLGETAVDLAEGTNVILDGFTGQLLVDPDPNILLEYRVRRAESERRRAEALAGVGEPAVTRDGHRVEVAANIGDEAGARLAVANGAEAVGLLRTEFLYLDRSSPPSEDEQVAAYTAIADALEGRPLIIRTLDIGGDKPALYLDLPEELNPFLGWRAIRFCLARPEVFKTQLRAILRAAQGRNIKVMFPMIATLDEIRQAKALLAEAGAELTAQGIPHATRIATGIMVEVPAAAVAADLLAPEVDFFSLGTNDLVQYTLAADRTNPRVAPLADPFNPAVLRLVKQVIDAGHAAGKWVGMCGEMAGMPQAIPILLGLGLDEFSMAPAAIPEAKALIRRLSFAEARDLATRVLSLRSATEMRNVKRET